MRNPFADSYHWSKRIWAPNPFVVLLRKAQTDLAIRIWTILVPIRLKKPEKNGFGPFSYKFFVCIRIGLRACINDVRKIKIGKNQNQNWVLIGRGSKPPDYASLFFGNRCQTKEVPRDLMFIFRKINIGGVHLIEGFPNATRQRPEHSRVTTAARRQTAPPHNTHNFCWHGPRQRPHGEGNR